MHQNHDTTESKCSFNNIPYILFQSHVEKRHPLIIVMQYRHKNFWTYWVKDLEETETIDFVLFDGMW